MTLILIVAGTEFFNEEDATFSTEEDVTLELEHSLLSVSKWEMVYQKPFLAPGEKSDEEVLGYIRAMDLSGNFTDEVAKRLSDENSQEINDYISSSQSATTFGKSPRSSGRSEIITSELIYYWMTAVNIPFECERWHLNRLLTLIQIANIKNSKQQNMPREEAAAERRKLNAQRKAQMGTTG